MSKNNYSTFSFQKFVDEFDLVKFVSKYTDLFERNGNYHGKCPLHDDSRPSFCIYENKRWVCFACNSRGGNIFDFYMELNGCNLPTAIEDLVEDKTKFQQNQKVELTTEECKWIEDALNLASIWKKMYTIQERKNFFRNRQKNDDRQQWAKENNRQTELFEALQELIKNYCVDDRKPANLAKIPEALPLTQDEVNSFVLGSDFYRFNCIELIKNQ